MFFGSAGVSRREKHGNKPCVSMRVETLKSFPVKAAMTQKVDLTAKLQKLKRYVDSHAASTAVSRDV